MATINPFTATGFDLFAMSRAISVLPNRFNRLVPIFPEAPITTTVVGLEMLNGTLNIVHSRPRGAAADKMIADKRSMIWYGIPHIPVEDALLPDDYQNVRMFGSENQAETQANVMARKLQKMKDALDQTREHLRIGALKGIILDADGSTMHNLYVDFGITQYVVDFALDDEDTDVRAKCTEVVNHIESNLKGETMTGVHAFVDLTFYNALVSHPNVEKAFAAYQALNQNNASDYRQRFAFNGIVFEVYSATWTDNDGNARSAIASGEGHALPEGTGNVFEEVVAPGNFVEAVNTMGVPYYAKQAPNDLNTKIKLWSESNVLPICKRPAVLVKLTS